MSATTNGLRLRLADFVQAHPGGWEHSDWEELLDTLSHQGFDVSDSDGIGLALEQERVKDRLQGIQGCGPKRVAALTERYPRLWDLEHASLEDLAETPSITRPLARTLHETLH